MTKQDEKIVTFSTGVKMKVVMERITKDQLLLLITMMMILMIYTQLYVSQWVFGCNMSFKTLFT